MGFVMWSSLILSEWVDGLGEQCIINKFATKVFILFYIFLTTVISSIHMPFTI